MTATIVSERLFLGITQSATGMKWIDRLGLRETNIALAIAQHHGIPDLVARILAGRGVSIEDAPQFIEPTIKGLMPDPRLLTDMEKASSRIVDAIVNREKVAIFGDYDVDGACSSALMSRFLSHYGIANSIYIPDRIFEGYGPNPQVMCKLVADGASLIITVDCGTNSIEAIEAAKLAGGDVIVLDHHQAGDILPHAATAIVNPNREDDISGQGHLCAAGIVFFTLVQVQRNLREKRIATDRNPLDLFTLLDLVALATICDVVSLKGINRAFVVKGLLVARSQKNIGLTALARVSRIGEPLNNFHFGFLIGPRINAGGRIGDAGLGARLLTLDDPIVAEQIAQELDRLNQERRAMEVEMLSAAEAEIAAELTDGQEPAIIVTASDSWHPGIVGLIASRLKEKMQRPAFAIAFNQHGIGTGSGRSIPGFDLGWLVRNAVKKKLLIKGGGHVMAAGITIQRAQLEKLRAYFEEMASEAVTKFRNHQSLAIDGVVSAAGATLALHDVLEKAGPYGAGHPQPILVLPHHRLTNVAIIGRDHVRAILVGIDGRRINAIAFRSTGNLLGEFLLKNPGRAVHIAGNLAIRHWNGSATTQIRIMDAVSAA